MKYSLSIALFALALGASMGCRTTPAETAQSTKQTILDDLLGSWKMMGKVQGREVEYSLLVEKVPGSEALVLRMKDAAEPPKYEALINIEMEEKTNKLAARWQDVLGAETSVIPGHGSALENRIELLFDNSEAPFRYTLEFDRPEGQWRFLIEYLTKDGDWITLADYLMNPK